MKVEVIEPHGVRHAFRVAGFNMVLTDEDAAAYLENSKGTTFPRLGRD